jgi:hypothetical protein
MVEAARIVRSSSTAADLQAALCHDGSLEQRAQLAEVALARGLVVSVAVSHRVPVLGTLVDLGAVARPNLVQGSLQRRDLLGGHARVLVGEAEVHLGRHLGGGPVRAVGRVGDQAAGVETGQGADAIRMRRRASA